MRYFVLTAAMTALAFQAQASSIVDIKTKPLAESRSVEAITCTTCRAADPQINMLYKVPVLTGEAQKLEIRNINGEKKLVRTEAMMGGSPVELVSTPTPDIMSALANATISDKTLAEAGKDGVDGMMTTAVGAPKIAPGEPVAASIADLAGPAEKPVKEINPESFQLRMK
ncbi:plant virulence effector HPE1-like domain-containing protein [Rhizobium sp. PAMB 3182]